MGGSIGSVQRQPIEGSCAETAQDLQVTGPKVLNFLQRGIPIELRCCLIPFTWALTPGFPGVPWGPRVPWSPRVPWGPRVPGGPGGLGILPMGHPWYPPWDPMVPPMGSHGSYPWIISMDDIDGLYPWIISMDDIYGWYRWIISMDYIHGWYLWMISIDDMYGWYPLMICID